MKRIGFVVITILIVGGVGYFAYARSPKATILPPVDYSVVLLTKPYTNNDLKFSLSMPGNFSAREIPADESGAHVITLESDDRDDGVQIITTPFDEDITALTEERIHQDVPDLTITDAQPVQIGEHNTGLAFKSDNESFGGASREVWFVFRGTLYQISTYDRLDPLLKKIFATWKFF